MRRNVSLNLTQLGSAAALLATLLLASAPALAQDDVTLTMARERFKEGVGYFDKKDFAKARVAFLQAYALKKHPAVLLNLAQSELRSGHEADAAKHFAQYLREHKDATEAERQGADTGLSAAKALVSEVTLEVDATGAEIYVDGDLEGQAPLPGSIYLTPGAHQIEARKDGKTTSAEVNATAGQATSVRLSLGRASKPAAPAGGGNAPLEDGGEAPSEEPHTSRQGFFPWLTHTPGAMIGVGLTGAGLIGGGAFAFGSKSSYDAAESVADQIADNAVKTDGKADGKGSGACTKPEVWLATASAWKDKTAAQRQDRAEQYVANCDKYTRNVKSGDTFKTLAIVSFAVAGAAAVGTIVYYIVDSKETNGSAAKTASKRRVMVLPVYQPGFAGGLVSGTF
ncbi:MAG TPA: PEGA domain-containing protein [Polyangiaceae bacterium]|nr:PEGA domain-containing protein [Polyangiaceae bacterium]